MNWENIAKKLENIYTQLHVFNNIFQKFPLQNRQVGCTPFCIFAFFLHFSWNAFGFHEFWNQIYKKDRGMYINYYTLLPF